MFWEKVNLNDYNFHFELQRNVYLCDLLKGQYEFVLERENVVIYEKKDGVSKKVDIEQLIYFLHHEVPQMIEKRYLTTGFYRVIDRSGRPQDYTLYVEKLYSCFGSVQKIRDTMNNMKVYLRCHKESEIFICYYCKDPCGKYYKCCKLGCCNECREEGPHPLNKCPFCSEYQKHSYE